MFISYAQISRRNKAFQDWHQRACLTTYGTRLRIIRRAFKRWRSALTYKWLNSRQNLMKNRKINLFFSRWHFRAAMRQARQIKLDHKMKNNKLKKYLFLWRRCAILFNMNTLSTSSSYEKLL
jgi:hypothetical protein